MPTTHFFLMQIGRHRSDCKHQLAMIWDQDVMLFQSFDHDFECGDAEEAKDLWKRFDGFIDENLTVAASLVCLFTPS